MARPAPTRPRHGPSAIMSRPPVRSACLGDHVPDVATPGARIDTPTTQAGSPRPRSSLRQQRSTSECSPASRSADRQGRPWSGMIPALREARDGPTSSKTMRGGTGQAVQRGGRASWRGRPFQPSPHSPPQPKHRRHSSPRHPSDACGLGPASVSAKGWVLAMLPPDQESGGARGSGPAPRLSLRPPARPKKTAPEGETQA
jgi:hypothetical protein